MQTFGKIAAQGDVIFRRYDHLPVGLTRVEPVDGALVVTHSETGHHREYTPEGFRKVID